MFFSIIVTYNPNISQLKACVVSLFSQVEKIIIVKNSAELLEDNCFQSGKIIKIQLDKNYGIAYAQNRGIEMAIALHADWILLSDQDTVYPGDYVSAMFEKSGKLENIGALCPVFFDEVKKCYSPVMISKMKGVQPEPKKIYKIANAISSGTLMPASIFEKVGFMQEDLFIDFVDFEWCWRLKKFGFSIYCISDVVIHHQLGDRMEKRFGLKIVYRSLFRFYYIIRNGYYLLTTDYLKGRDRFLFSLLMKKKIMEVLLLNNFSKESFAVVRKAIHNGKRRLFERYEEAMK